MTIPHYVQETRISKSKRDVPDRMRIIFLNRYFYPSQAPTGILLSDLAFTLRERGISVVVITSRLTYEESSTLLPRRETNSWRRCLSRVDIKPWPIRTTWSQPRLRVLFLGGGLALVVPCPSR